MTKHLSNRIMGPFGDFEVNQEEPKKDKRKNQEDDVKVSSKNKKDKPITNGNLKKNEKNQRIQDFEKHERERRERYEQEVAEAERNERDLEMERWEKERRRNRNKNFKSGYKPRRPPPGYKDPHEACKQALPARVKEKKRQEMKALMNCIAFSPSQTSITEACEESQTEIGKDNPIAEEIDNSYSSETTSDITEVTPRSSSSGCSSMSKRSVCIEKLEKNQFEGGNVHKGKDENVSKKENENNFRKSNNKIPEEGKKKDNQTTEQEVRNLTEEDLEEIEYLQDTFEDLDLDEEATDFASSIISGLSEERRAKCSRKNMTFTNEQLREIERVNLILLKKIMNHRKPKVKSQNPQTVNRKTSAAINRSRMEEKIERENKILLKKLQSAKGTTGTLSRKSSQSTFY